MSEPLPVDPLAPSAPRVDKVTICSVWPHPLEASLMHGGGCRVYKLAPAPRDGYSLCDCYNTYELCLDTQHDDDNTAPGLVPKPLTAQQVVNILLRLWTLDVVTPGGGRIGVAAIAGSKPTEAELAALRQQQLTHDQELVADADVLNISPAPQQRSRIGKRHRRALEDLGSPDPSAHPWYAAPYSGPRKDCPACAKPILAKALKCEHCQTSLPQFYMEMGVEPPETDPVVLGAFRRVLAAKQRPAPSKA